MATNQLMDNLQSAGWSDVLFYLLGFFEQAVADFVLTCEILVGCWVGWFLVVFVGGLILGLWDEEDSSDWAREELSWEDLAKEEAFSW